MIGLSCSPSCSEDAPIEDQEKHTATDLVEVVVWIHDFCGLPHALAEDKTMRGFCAAQDLDYHAFFHIFPWVMLPLAS